MPIVRRAMRHASHAFIHAALMDGARFSDGKTHGLGQFKRQRQGTGRQDQKGRARLFRWP
ncbi:protein of unknown function [Candidatus Filomicrobium marinum]|uniref:Uncharacterized protein n=1 Tax=Candidatus Filomicrobium marinum TaxID=1608628 RepID=A0A0D6JBX0_9HYPH|nr:protein of unknown function [Candidatus Filomicrobium marinum]CPR16657.1 protein of unknown function [Candidatus Filomicrobium marinum]